MRNFLEKSCRENKTHFMFNNVGGFFFLENHTVHEIMCKTTVEWDSHLSQICERT